MIIRPITLDDKNEVFEYLSDKETNKYQGWISTNLSNVETFIGNYPYERYDPEKQKRFKKKIENQILVF